MSDQTAAELEHEAELARARISDTADSLRNKMSPGQMVDEVTSYFRGSDGGLAFGNLASQIRDNPIPAALVGVGLAWLFASSGTASAKSTASEADTRRPVYSWDDDDLQADQNEAYARTAARSGYAAASGAASTAADAVTSAASGVGDAIRSTVSGVGAALHGAVGAATDAAGAAASGIGSATAGIGGAGKAAYRAGSRAAGGATRTGGVAKKQFTDLLSDEPLILAALGVAVGAAIGAAFPSTKIEDEAVGSYRDQLRDKIGDTATEAMSQARDVASETYANLKDAASQAGLGEHGDDLVDAVKHVVSDTVESVQSSVRDRLGGEQGESAGNRGDQS